MMGEYDAGYENYIDGLHREIIDYQIEVEQVKGENAKLRELVRVFYHCTTSGECDECPINGGGPVHLMPDTICDTIHDRMRELGVEP